MTKDLTPRSGIAGLEDHLLGPGASGPERLLVWCVTIISPLVLILVVNLSQANWSLLQQVLGAIIIADLAGGVIANSTASGKRWWHRPGQGFKQHLLFNALHLHPIVIAYFFLDGDWSYLYVNYGYLLLASVVLFTIQIDLQRPVALLSTCLIIVVNTLIFPLELAWFAVFYFMKLLVAHNVKELCANDE